jgi:hypothetical protein
VEIDPRKPGQVIHGAPVTSIETLRSGDGKIPITVGSRGARVQLRELAAKRSLTEEVDFVCVT